MMHDVEDLIRLFNHSFEKSYNTRLERGGDEPLYLPASENKPYHAIFFAHGFFSSALHECAHWFIAGEARRQLVDFGYWYQPDGRNAAQQKIFEQVEVKPQAIEWILSKAANHPFRASIDNLQGEETNSNTFKKAIHGQVNIYLQTGLPARAEIFRQAIGKFYGGDLSLSLEAFNVAHI